MRNNIVELGTPTRNVGDRSIPPQNFLDYPRFTMDTGWYSTECVILKSGEDLTTYKSIPADRKLLWNGSISKYIPYMEKEIAQDYNTDELIQIDNKNVSMVMDNKRKIHFAKQDPVFNVYEKAGINTCYPGDMESIFKFAASKDPGENYTNYTAALKYMTAKKLAALEISGSIGGSRNINYNFPYKLKDYGPRLKRTQSTFNSLTGANKNGILVNPRVATLGKYLEDLSLGLELETCATKVYPPKLCEMGLIPLADGSLSFQGKEFASLPIRNEIQLQSVFNGIKYIKEVSKVDETCALHLHIGNVPRTKEFFVALYMLYQRLQEEIFSLLPHYLRNPTATVGKSKNYAAPLPKLKLIEDREQEVLMQVEAAFTNIYGCCIGTQVAFESFDKAKKVPWQRSWNSASRYTQLNLVNAMLNPDGTVEFRAHPPTLNSQKIYLWITLCAAIVLYAKHNTIRILSSIINREKIILQDVIDHMIVKSNSPFRELHTILTDYVNYNTDLRIEQELEAITSGNHNGGLGRRYNIYRAQIKKELLADATFDIEYEI